MTDLTIRERGPISANSQYADALLQAGLIAVNQNDYSTDPDSTVLDRVYNVKGLVNMHVEIENTGIIENGLTYRIENARKEFKTISTLVDADFDEEIKADTNVAASLKATGTVTIASPVANTFSTGTVDLTGGASGSVDGITVDSVEVMSGAESFDTDLTTTAANVASNITANTSSPNYTATSSGTLITITADALGSGPNTFVVQTTTTTITTTSVPFAGGVDADIVTPNGLIYTAVVGARANDTQFSIDGDDTATAVDLAAAINGDVRVGTLNDLTATNSSAVVTMTQTVVGTGGNATTLTSSDGTRLAVSGATFTGGTDAVTSISDTIDISPESTAIRIKIKRETAGQDTTLAGIVSVN